MCKAILCRQPSIATTLPMKAPYEGDSTELAPWWNVNDKRCITGPDGHGYSLSLYVDCPPAEKASQCEHVKQYDQQYCRSKKVCPPPTRFEIGQFDQWPFYPGNSPATGVLPTDVEKAIYVNANYYWGPSGQNIAAPPHHGPYYEWDSCLTDTDPDTSTTMHWPDAANTARRRFNQMASSPYSSSAVIAKVQEIKAWDVTIKAALEACQPLCAAA